MNGLGFPMESFQKVAETIWQKKSFGQNLKFTYQCIKEKNKIFNFNKLSLHWYKDWNHDDTLTKKEEKDRRTEFKAEKEVQVGRLSISPDDLSMAAVRIVRTHKPARATHLPNVFWLTSFELTSKNRYNQFWNENHFGVYETPVWTSSDRVFHTNLLLSTFRFPLQRAGLSFQASMSSFPRLFWSFISLACRLKKFQHPPPFRMIYHLEVPFNPNSY